MFWQKKKYSEALYLVLYVAIIITTKQMLIKLDVQSMMELDGTTAENIRTTEFNFNIH